MAQTAPSSPAKPIFGMPFFLFCKALFKFYCPLKIQGQENLPTTPFILCSNHCSHMDTPVLMLATGQSFHRFGMIAAKDYFFDNKKRKQTVNLFMNLIPISRKCTRETIVKNIAECRKFIQQQMGNLIIYPEGTRSLNGDMQPFKRGPALIADELGLPLVPAHIKGTYYSLGKGKNLPKPGKISVIFGKPIYLAPHDPNQNKKRFDIYRHLISTLEQQIQQLKEMHSEA